MTAPLIVAVEGIGLWAPSMPGWDASEDWLAGRTDSAPESVARPAPDVMAPTERRRAPESVLLALDVAAQACKMAGRDPRDLPNIFASGYGDVAINHYLCETLARAPHELSPTKFHNSVHNAPAGYWCIATGCMASSTALTASEATFGAGLLEATMLALAENTPVLVVVYDLAAAGPLVDVIPSRSSFACAFVLAPAASSAAMKLRITTASTSPKLAPDAALLQSVDPGNPAMRALSLLRALARRESTHLQFAAAPALNLDVEVCA
jgi:Beta-ketoacyl synthase, N-terminal domain